MLITESLNSDEQQFHQYPQNVLLVLTSTHWTQNTTTYDVENLDPKLRHAQQCDKLKPDNGITSHWCGYLQYSW
jgi:hypothetical protein